MGERLNAKEHIEIYSVFLLQYLKGKDHTGNADEDGRIRGLEL